MNTTSLLSIGLGVFVGTLSSIAYFIHLKTQVRKLINHTSYRLDLLLSAFLRMGVFLATGWLLSSVAGPLSGVGYGIAFLMVRTIVIQGTQ